MKKIRIFWNFSRPFTLIPPVVGIVSGALVGIGATRVEVRWRSVLLAALAAINGMVFAFPGTQALRAFRILWHVDLDTVGVILVVVGVVGLLLSLLWMTIWADRRRDRSVISESATGRRMDRDVY